MIFLYPEGEPPPPPKYIHRPSYDEVRQRELEIARWDENHLAIQREWDLHKKLVSDFYRTKSRVMTVRAILIIVSCICLLSSIYPLAMGLFLSSLFANWALMQRGSVPAFESPVEPPRPACISIRPFTQEENDYFLRNADPKDFQTYCPCPSCGVIGLHDLSSSPTWVVRTCGTCRRKWSEK